MKTYSGKVQDFLDYMKTQETQIQNVRSTYLELIDLFPQYADNIYPIAVCNQIDFEFLKHEDACVVMNTLAAGKWNKTPEQATINYTVKEWHNGVTVRLYRTEPGPHCRVIEVEETLPAVPERKMITIKVVCGE
jgi:hypothetical protein